MFVRTPRDVVSFIIVMNLAVRLFFTTLKVSDVYFVKPAFRHF